APAAQRPERALRAALLGLPLRPRPPPPPPEPRTDHAAPVAARDLRHPGDADRPQVAALDDEVEVLAELALRGQALEIRDRLLLAFVRAPREEPRDLGVRAQAIERRGVGQRGQAERQRRTGDREVLHVSAIY